MTVRAVLTDIEGTTTSIAFVHEVLFPYAKAGLGPFLRSHHSEPAVAAEVAAVRAAVGRPDLDLEGVIATLEGWIAEDRKATPLKTLQGLIWRAGYENGDYRAHVYPDAVEGLRRWRRDGLALYVYSSGSIAAQKLFFGHSEAGDLTPLFNGYFDTTSGGKKEADSYRAIQAEIGVAADAILFLSDVEAELDAARAAGLRTVLLDRDDAIADSDHTRVTTFDDIEPRAL